MSNLKQAIPKRMAGFHGDDYLNWIGQTIAGMHVMGFTRRVVNVRRQRRMGIVLRPERDDTVQGYCTCTPEVSRSLLLRRLRDHARANQLFPCSLCRPERKKTEYPTASSDGRVSAVTLKRMDGLPVEQQQEVRQMVYNHVKACLANQFTPENLDRVFIEAIEIVKVEARTGLRTITETVRYEPERRYGQYEPPKDAWMN